MISNVVFECCSGTKVAFSRAPGRAELWLVLHHPHFPWLWSGSRMGSRAGHMGRDRDSSVCVSGSSQRRRSSSAGPALPEGDSRAPSCAQQRSLGWDSRGCTARCVCRVHPFPLLSAELGQHSSILHSPDVLEPFKLFPVPKSFGCTFSSIENNCSVTLFLFSKQSGSLNTQLPLVHVCSFLGKHQFSFF